MTRRTFDYFGFASVNLENDINLILFSEDTDAKVCWGLAALTVSTHIQMVATNSYDNCKSFCSTDGNLGAALSEDFCYCLSELPEDDKQVEGSFCDVFCDGDSKGEQICGGQRGAATVLILEQDASGK